MNFVPTKNKRSNVATGLNQAVCIGVWDLGTQAQTGAYANNPPTDKVLFAWETQSGDIVYKEYTREIDQWTKKDGKTGRTKLKEDLESWFAPRTIDDPDRFDARRVLGQHCTLVIGLTSGGNPKVTAIAPPDKNQMNWSANRDFMYFEIGDEIPVGTENWIANKIANRILPGEEPQMSPREGSQAGAESQPVPF